MRLFEAILEANHRAVSGDSTACLHPAEFASALPVVALTCIDVRLNKLLPNILGIADEDFIWLRNAGNIVTGPMSSTLRSVALACTVKGGKEIAIIGHTDCRVGQTGIGPLTDAFRALGIQRGQLPENLAEFFGMFASERQNVITGVDLVRSSPIIGPRVPVHGLLVDVRTGCLEWLVNGYQALERAALAPGAGPQRQAPVGELLSRLESFTLGEMKSPEGQIGEAPVSARTWLSHLAGVQGAAPGGLRSESEPMPPRLAPPSLAVPPPLKPVQVLQQAWKKGFRKG